MEHRCSGEAKHRGKGVRLCLFLLLGHPATDRSLRQGITQCKMGSQPMICFCLSICYILNLECPRKAHVLKLVVPLDWKVGGPLGNGTLREAHEDHTIEEDCQSLSSSPLSLGLRHEQICSYSCFCHDVLPSWKPRVILSPIQPGLGTLEP